MSRIETMPPDIAAQIEPYREAWRRLALSTEPLDRKASAAAIRNLYTKAGLEPPKVMHFSSPMMALLARGALMQLGDQLWDQLRGQLGRQLRDQLGDQLGRQLRDQLRGQLRDQLRDQLGGPLWGQLRGQLGDQLRDQLGGPLWDQLRDQLGRQLRDQLGGPLGRQLRDQLRGPLRGQLRGQLGDQLRGPLRGQLFQSLWFLGAADAFWLGFYDFPRRLGVAYANADHLDAYIKYAKNSSFGFCYASVALVSDRPSILKFDAQRRLHSESGPAMSFSDGWSIYAWRGLLVSADLIEKRHEITPQQIRAERNAEMRRAMAEIYDEVHGDGAMVRDLGGRLISQDDLHGFPREIYEVDGLGEGNEPARFIVLRNGSLEPDGSRKIYTIGIPSDVATPHDAIAWKFGVAPDLYREAVRT